MRIKRYNFPLIVLILGVIFSLYLQWQIPEGVFFSGDAGLKALLAQQFSRGQFRFDLAPPIQTWVRDLWQNGLYPFEEPFVYNLNNRYYITFPYTFPLITAPFQALFGYRGLYFIPLISTWAIWLIFYFACQRLNLSKISTSIGLVILIFASPLTLYSAMYWEHTLAVALAFYGLSHLLIPDNSEGLSKKQAVLSGVFIGLSVWFRPEFLALVGLVALLVYSASLVHLNQLRFLAQNKEFLVISMVLTVGLFFLSNQLAYSHPLGIHAIQVVEKLSLFKRLSDGLTNFKGLGFALFEYLPITYFFILYLGLCLFRRGVGLTPHLGIIYLICLVFTIGVSLLVPVGTAGLIAGGKQWGARFLLILVPIISLMVVKELTLIRKTDKPILGYISLFIFSMLLLIGLHKNTYDGVVYLQKNHQGILPAIEFLKKQENTPIAISHQFVAQALEPGLGERRLFFKAEDRDQLVKLGAALVEQGQQKFTYICYPFSKCNIAEENSDNFKFNKGTETFKIELSELGKFGKYPIYEAEIINQP